MKIWSQARRAAKEREQRLLEEGLGRGSRLPQTPGNGQTQYIAFAERQLVAAIIKNPAFLRQAAPRLQGVQFFDAGMGEAFALLCEKDARGEPIDLAALSGELPEETLARVSQVLAQNYDIGISAQDVEMYLTRIENSRPVSASAGERSAGELAAYIQSLKEKKA